MKLSTQNSTPAKITFKNEVKIKVFFHRHIQIVGIYCQPSYSTRNNVSNYQQDGQIRRPSIVSLLKNSLASIHSQKCLSGSARIQVGDCKASVKSNAEDSLLKMQDITQEAESLTMVPATDPEKSPSSEDLAATPFDSVLSQASYIKVLVAQSCPILCDPMDWTPPGSSVHGILQARILE